MFGKDYTFFAEKWIYGTSEDKEGMIKKLGTKISKTVENKDTALKIASDILNNQGLDVAWSIIDMNHEVTSVSSFKYSIGEPGTKWFDTFKSTKKLM